MPYGPAFFTCVPTQRQDSFLFSEKLVLINWSCHLFYFILKGTIKQERKP